MDTVKTNLLIQMEILGRWLATIVVVIAVGAFLLALFRAKEGFGTAFETAVAIAGGVFSSGSGRAAGSTRAARDLGSLKN